MSTVSVSPTWRMPEMIGAPVACIVLDRRSRFLRSACRFVRGQDYRRPRLMAITRTAYSPPPLKPFDCVGCLGCGLLGHILRGVPAIGGFLPLHSVSRDFRAAIVGRLGPGHVQRPDSLCGNVQTLRRVRRPDRQGSDQPQRSWSDDSSLPASSSKVTLTLRPFPSSSAVTM